MIMLLKNRVNFVVCRILVEILIAQVMVGTFISPILDFELLVCDGEHSLHHESIIIDMVHRSGNIHAAEEFLDATEILFLFVLCAHICVGV